MTEETAQSQCAAIVSDFFKGDEEKIKLWWATINPNLGATPRAFIMLGRATKLLEWMKNQIEGDLP